MDGSKMARIRRCARCEYGRACGAWHWPRCVYHPDAPRDRDEEFMEGPVDNCSAGYWDGLESVGPVDTEEWESWNQAQLAQKRTQAQRERWAPMFEVLLGGGTQEDADAKLEIMVRDYGLEPAVAVEISDSVAALMKGR